MALVPAAVQGRCLDPCHKVATLSRHSAASRSSFRCNRGHSRLCHTSGRVGPCTRRAFLQVTAAQRQSGSNNSRSKKQKQGGGQRPTQEQRLATQPEGRSASDASRPKQQTATDAPAPLQEAPSSAPAPMQASLADRLPATDSTKADAPSARQQTPVSQGPSSEWPSAKRQSPVDTSSIKQQTTSRDRPAGQQTQANVPPSEKDALTKASPAAQPTPVSQGPSSAWPSAKGQSQSGSSTAEKQIPPRDLSAGQQTQANVPSSEKISSAQQTRASAPTAEKDAFSGSSSAAQQNALSGTASAAQQTQASAPPAEKDAVPGASSAAQQAQASAPPAEKDALPRAPSAAQQTLERSPPAEKDIPADATPVEQAKATGVKFTQQAGRPEPLGPSLGPDQKGINFALYSEHASEVALEIFNSEDNSLHEIKLDPAQNKTQHVWHVLVEGLPTSGALYAYKVQGQGGWETGGRWYPDHMLLDPYAPLISGRRRFGVRDEVEKFEQKQGSLFWSTYDFASAAFDWGSDYQRPNLPWQDLIVYEMGVRSFTAGASSGVGDGKQGTFQGLVDKIPHLVELGINAVELLPVFEYDELEFQRTPNPRDHMVNIWGYSHINFFAPMSRFAADGAGPAAAAKEFKHMVQQLHNADIEVILDVVYNHTAEGGDDDPYVLSFRGIDNEAYYMVDPNNKSHLLNYSGCGNTTNANHPATKQMIVDSCKRWVEEYHVDGFRFDLASCLCRDSSGNPMAVPPLIRDIAKDPVLSKVKLIAEPWDCGGLYQVGGFPNWDIWGEWNGKYRDDVRRFIKGDAGVKNAFATRIAGSADLYNVNNRKPYHGTNFVIAHDGFTLYDLVAYNGKHNDANGEQNRDGSNDNFSWNCGHEGQTDDAGVNALRQRQMRNMMLALMVSQGTPMVLMGDEYAQTRNGNNNYYGHDTELTRFDWNQLDKVRDSYFRFYSELIKFRKQHPLLGRSEFLRPNDITWHEDNWGNTESRFLAFTLHDLGQGGGDLYVVFNAHTYPIDAHLPKAPEGKTWRRVVDTNLQSPKDFTPGGNKGVDSVYSVQPFSSILLVAK